jgi:hypothetical protein
MKKFRHNGKIYKEIKAPLRRQSNLNGDDHILGATFIIIILAAALTATTQIIKIIFP